MVFFIFLYFKPLYYQLNMDKMHSIYKNKHFHEDEKVEQETLTDCPNTNTNTLQL